MRTRTIIRAIILCLLMWSTVIADPGDTVWTRVLGTNLDDIAYAIDQTIDGGYIIAGMSGGPVIPYCYDVFLVKTDESGDSQWTHKYGQTDSFEAGRSIQQTHDGGYIIGGYTDMSGESGRDFYLIKTDSNGDSLWTRTYGDILDEQAHSVGQTSDGGYILAGWTVPLGLGRIDMLIVKTDPAGNPIWEYQNNGFLAEEAYSIQQTSDEGYILTGWTQSYGAGHCDFYVVKLDSTGEEIWTNTYGGVDDDLAYSIRQTSDDGYIIAGSTLSFDVAWGDIYLVRTDALGDTIWTRTFGDNNAERALSVAQTSDDGFIIAGYRGNGDIIESYDCYVLKTNSEGDLIWANTYGGYDFDQAFCIKQNSEGNYIVVGSTNSFSEWGSDIYLLLLEGENQSTVPDPNNAYPTGYDFCVNYPNPFNSSTIIDYNLSRQSHVVVSIYDILGRKVTTLQDCARPAGNHQLVWNAENVTSGIYFYMIHTGDFSVIESMTLVK
ncbi:MAG: T9SS type A sorting domain-containing protein [candidate division Zixibacteria bacterium]|nr:T9SS type A sorting domain-containing protein [candidate division Zixibacteria bacterium]